MTKVEHDLSTGRPQAWMYAHNKPSYSRNTVQLKEMQKCSLSMTESFQPWQICHRPQLEHNVCEP